MASPSIVNSDPSLKLDNIASETILQSSIVPAATPSAISSGVNDAKQKTLYNALLSANMSSLESDEILYSLNSSTTGCYRKGAIPVALARNDTCNLGFYCPNSTNDQPPQYCPPAESCQGARLTKATCPEQGRLEPIVCKMGFYCPLGGKQMLPCPESTFCPMGSYQPLNCSYAAYCPPKSSRQIVRLPLGFMITIDVAMTIIVLIGFAISRWRKSRKRVHYSTLPTADVDDIKLDQNGSKVKEREVEADDYINPDFQHFIRSLSRCIKTKEVGLSFDFDELSFEAKGHKKILSGVTGSIVSGSFWAIMGGSGAGKTTFLNVLMGKTKNTGGIVRVNGVRKDISEYKKVIGYVPQDDIVLPELTVRENILHSARIRLPSDWADRDIQAHVDSLISCLQLSHVQHSRVGDANRPVISGGQRKRVSIGIELAAAPMALFLDEPTSGLDATSAASIMRLLKAISRLGVTTVAIIHQPREQIFIGFDNLLLLGSGRQLYAGPTREALAYFDRLGFTFPANSNPADTIMDIITGNGQQYTSNKAWKDNGVQLLIEEWNCYNQDAAEHNSLSVTSTQTTLRPPSAISIKSARPISIQSTPEQEEVLKRSIRNRGARWYTQVYYCLKRAIVQQVRNPSGFFFEIIVGGLAGGVIGLSAFAASGQLFHGIYLPPFTILSSAVDYQSVPQIGLLGGLAIGLAASAPGVKVFGEEKLVYWREAASGHSRSAYYIGKVVSTIPRIALSALHFTVFFGILATPLMSFNSMFLANLLYFYCIYGLASCVSMIVRRENGPLLAVMTSLVIGVLGGVAPPLSKVKMWHMTWLWRASPGTWFTEGYFTENLLPLKYLYVLELAEKGLGFTLGQFGMDMW
ncbi:MAG: hypothetical protein M1834_007523 [Cirrosporium novae-zelandiae]|nr:MAG: hypothetical protein M1834_007523 [Cirrosporium novae-zelandiae]